MSQLEIEAEVLKLKELFKITNEELRNFEIKNKLYTFARLKVNSKENLKINALKLFKKGNYHLIIKRDNLLLKNNESLIEKCNLLKEKPEYYNKIKKFCKVHRTWEEFINHKDDVKNHFRCICGQKHIVNLYPVVYKNKIYVIGSDCILSIDLMLKSKDLTKTQIENIEYAINTTKQYLKDKTKKYTCIKCDKKFGSKINKVLCRKCLSSVNKLYENFMGFNYKRSFKILYGPNRNKLFSEVSTKELIQYLDCPFVKNNKKYGEDFDLIKKYLKSLDY